jgi:hypothetical protein
MSARGAELERLAELAVQRWLEGLGAPESIEFETLRARHPTFDIESLEAVAAALGASLAASPDTLPERVRLQLAQGADEYFGLRAIPSEGLAQAHFDRVSTTSRRQSWFAYGGWLAAAASLLLSVSLWVKRPAAVDAARTAVPPPVASKIRDVPAAASTAATTTLARADNVPDQSPAATARADSVSDQRAPATRSADSVRDQRAPATARADSVPDQRAPATTRADSVPDQHAPATTRAERAEWVTERAEFMRTHAWLMQRSFLPGPDPTGETVTGDVVWDAKSQTGYMRFHGLRLNDPIVDQYQLWIFDARRDERFPVDGGVFDVGNASGDEVVRFTARLPVAVPLMFVVTVERPGGVVVSDRSRVAAVAHIS